MLFIYKINIVITFQQLTVLFRNKWWGPVGAFNVFSQPMMPVTVLLKHCYTSREFFLMLYRSLIFILLLLKMS